MVITKIFNRFNKVQDKKIDKYEFYIFIKYAFNKLGCHEQSKLFT